ncbi:hypothetical protein Tco_0475542 [Tanacetum coccineum]
MLYHDGTNLICIITKLDYMETENAQDVGRTRDVVEEEKENDEDVLSTEDILSTDTEKVSTDKEKVSTDKEKVSTDRPIVSTDGSKVITNKQKDSTDEQSKDDETIAKVLLNTSQAKAVLREKEKGPLPKIDPKDKGKKKIEEEDESKSKSDAIPEAEKKFKQLASDEEMARKVQEEWEGEEERKQIS